MSNSLKGKRTVFRAIVMLVFVIFICNVYAQIDTTHSSVIQFHVKDDPAAGTSYGAQLGWIGNPWDSVGPGTQGYFCISVPQWLDTTAENSLAQCSTGIQEMNVVKIIREDSSFINVTGLDWRFDVHGTMYSHRDIHAPSGRTYSQGFIASKDVNYWNLEQSYEDPFVKVSDKKDDKEGDISYINKDQIVTANWNGSGETNYSTASYLTAAGDIVSIDTDNAKSTEIKPGNSCIKNGSQTQIYLQANGKIECKELKVTVTPSCPADYVFADDYKLKSLEEVEKHIAKHKHLPGVPSAKEMVDDGVNVVEMQMKLLEKVEELTLHIIAMKKENAELKEELTKLR